mmetsp:Transcript_5917/g.5773  ORF Transcript_5917/g.5773 Transcript_5917/m.5773 type:complete len:304 (+) Transcript_5917:660-1571(+)
MTFTPSSTETRPSKSRRPMSWKASDPKDMPGAAFHCRPAIATVGTIARRSRNAISKPRMQFAIVTPTPRTTTPTEIVPRGCNSFPPISSTGCGRRGMGITCRHSWLVLPLVLVLVAIMVTREAIISRQTPTTASSTLRVLSIWMRRCVWPTWETIANGIPKRILVTRHVVMAVTVAVAVVSAPKTILRKSFCVRIKPARPRVWPRPNMAASAFGTKAPGKRSATLITTKAAQPPKKEERKDTTAARRETTALVVVPRSGTLPIGYTLPTNRGTTFSNGVGTTSKHHKSGQPVPTFKSYPKDNR